MSLLEDWLKDVYWHFSTIQANYCISNTEVTFACPHTYSKATYAGVDCVWNVMAHAQKWDFVLLRLKCDDTCAESRFRFTAFEMWWHTRRNQISSYWVWNVMAHAQEPDFVLLRLKCEGPCAETKFRFTAFEMWWHMRRNQISSYSVWNVMAHAQKPFFIFRRNGRVYLNRQGASVQSTTGSRGVRISGSNAGIHHVPR
jgi:hypothetical protein